MSGAVSVSMLAKFKSWRPKLPVVALLLATKMLRPAPTLLALMPLRRLISATLMPVSAAMLERLVVENGV